MPKLFFLIGILTGGLLMWLFLQVPSQEDREFMKNVHTHACGAYHTDGWIITEFTCEQVVPTSGLASTTTPSETY